AVGADDAVARNDDRARVVSVRASHGALTAGSIDIPGQPRLGDRGSVGDPAEARPDALLERRAPRCAPDPELGQRPVEICRQLARDRVEGRALARDDGWTRARGETLETHPPM